MLEALGGQTGTGRLARHRQRLADTSPLMLGVRSVRADPSHGVRLDSLAAGSCMRSNSLTE